MKKTLAIFILIVVCTTLFSCNSGKNNVDTDDSVNTSESTETEDLSKKLSEMGEMDFTIVSDNGKEIIPCNHFPDFSGADPGHGRRRNGAFLHRKHQ